MHFCNPGFLGSKEEFRRRFALPIERHRDARQAQRLRQLVGPFILRRLKTDPNVISDLPACVETKEYATLTAEQAALYQGIASAMLGEADRATGIRRRGVVLAALVRLKQLCNHPALLLREPVPQRPGTGTDAMTPPLPNDKSARVYDGSAPPGHPATAAGTFSSHLYGVKVTCAQSPRRPLLRDQDWPNGRRPALLLESRLARAGIFRSISVDRNMP